MKFYRSAMLVSAAVIVLAIRPVARAQTDRHGRPLQPQAQTNGDDDADDTDTSEKADAVIKRHSKELKVAHVRDVESDEKENGEVVINVEVDKKKNVDEVARKVPPRLEGFPVDVVFAEIGQGDFTINGLPIGEGGPGDDSSAGTNIAPGTGRSAFQSESHYLGKTNAPGSPSSPPQ